MSKNNMKKIFGFILVLVIIVFSFKISTIVMAGSSAVLATDGTLGEVTIRVDEADIKSDSVKLRATGNITAGTYHFSIYKEDGYPTSRNKDFNSVISQKNYEVASSIQGIEMTFSGLEYSTRYVGVLYKDSYDNFIDTHFATLLDPNAKVEERATPPATETPAVPKTNTPAATAKTGDSALYKGGIVPECNTGPIDDSPGGTGQYLKPCDFNFFMDLINRLIKFLLFVIATPLVALILMYTGYLYITSGGNAGQVEKVKHILLNAVVGYVIALAAWLVVNTITTTLLSKDAKIDTFLDKSSMTK